MIIKNVSLANLQDAATAISDSTGGVKLTVDARGKSWKVNLRPDGDTYRTYNPINGHRKYAVCWHGFLDFFRALYALQPEAVIESNMAGKVRYTSLADLEEKKYLTYRVPMTGPMYGSIPYGDTCDCGRGDN